MKKHRREIILVLIITAFCVFLFAGIQSVNHSLDSSEDAASTEQDTGAAPQPAAYADLIFDSIRVHTIEISMPEEDRMDQLENPKDKTKYRADAVIDGEEIKDVAFGTKGNSSLFFVADAGKDKFSYGISFGKYVKGQTFHGLDKLSLQMRHFWGLQS